MGSEIAGFEQRSRRMVGALSLLLAASCGSSGAGLSSTGQHDAGRNESGHAGAEPDHRPLAGRHAPELGSHRRAGRIPRYRRELVGVTTWENLADDSGYNAFTPEPDGTHRYLERTVDPSIITGELNALLAALPLVPDAGSGDAAPTL